MRCKVFYDDGGIHEGPKPPPTGVQVIVMPNPEGGIMTATKSDYYVLREDRWYGVDIFGLFDYLMDSGLVLFGRTMPGKEFKRILEQAVRTEFD